MTSSVLIEKRFPAAPERLREIREAVREAALSCGCGEGCARDVVLAVDEACQNIIRHAYRGAAGDIVLVMEHEDGVLVVRLRDFADPVDPAMIKPRPLGELRPGGLGVHFMRRVMDEVCFVEPPAGGGNMLRMTKRIESD